MLPVVWGIARIVAAVAIPIILEACGSTQKRLAEGGPTPEEAFLNQSKADPRNAHYVADGYEMASACQSVSDPVIGREWASLSARQSLVEKICPPKITREGDTETRMTSAQIYFSEIIDAQCDDSICCATAAVKRQDVQCGE